MEELVKWLGEENPDAEASALILQQLKQADTAGNPIPAEIMARLEAKLPNIFAAEKQRAGVVSLFMKNWMRYAAIFVVLAGIGLYFILSNKPASNNQSLATTQPLTTEEIQPGKNGAVLTLVDGSKVVLDSLGNGLITTQNGT